MGGLSSRRHFLRWLPAYVMRRRPRTDAEPRHLLFCVCDHFEPGWKRPDLETERRRVAAWAGRYPALADRFLDADGRPPQHTFFYPCEEYRAEHLARLAELTARGCAEVEIHLHHDNDTAAGLAATIEEFKARLRGHGLLGADAEGRVRFGFIHGNWALDNSRPDGRWCGVNDELRTLRELGCYADFTYPSAPDLTQPAKINSIYWAADDPAAPASHARGVDVAVGEEPRGDLLLVQGPLALDWGARKYGLLPALENGDISGPRPPSARRVRLWAAQGIAVRGRPEWVIVKVYTHGCQERNADALLGAPAAAMHETLHAEYNDGQRWRLHYVTARELVNVIHAARTGRTGDPGQYRDFAIAPPPARVGVGATTVTKERP